MFRIPHVRVVEEMRFVLELYSDAARKQSRSASWGNVARPPSGPAQLIMQDAAAVFQAGLLRPTLRRQLNTSHSPGTPPRGALKGARARVVLSVRPTGRIAYGTPCARCCRAGKGMGGGV